MTKFFFGVLLIVLIAFGGYFIINYKVEAHYEGGQFSYLKISPRGNRQAIGTDGSIAVEPATTQVRPSFRIASFNLDGLDENKLDTLLVGEVLTRVVPQFELIALEGVRGKNQGVLVRLIERINAVGGRNYNFATGPTQKRDGIEHYSAFVFDRAVLDIDLTMLNFVEDPLDRFRHKPLVGAFRVHGIDPAQAFTFRLLVVETDPKKPAQELDLLAEVYRKLRNDGRNEDDIITLGDFQADDAHLGRLGNLLGMTAVISNIPTTVRGTQLLDNILFDRRATSEFTGRCGVVDLMRQFELTIEQASAISSHLPVWAEFSSYEGGQKGYVPSTPAAQIKTQ